MVAGSHTFAGWLGTLALVAAAAGSAWAAAAEMDFFESRIRPLLARQCYACHSSKQKTPMGGLALDTRAGVRRGGKSGPAVAPGDPAASLLLKAVEHAPGAPKMPPSGKLPAQALADLRQWIGKGAPDPRETATPAAVSTTSDWWSLKPIRRPPVPTLPAEGHHWARTPIDAFIAAKLREKGLTPSPEADRRTLARRVWFNLTGLPPTPEELAAFLADPAPGAYERLVDRLLASPRYGERWARHWMDAAHFAETNGYETDQPREHAWPYREYLIAAFNQDKPYGRFIEEQVAGDALFPGDPQALVATGFLAAGPWDQNTIPPFQPDRPDVIRAYYLDRDDMVATVMSTFNSVTVHCARCHDHKFDPISQEDHYSLQAVFAGVDRADRPFDDDPAVHRQRQELIREWQALDRRDAAVVTRLDDPQIEDDAARWAGDVRPRLAPWTVVAPEILTVKRGASLAVQPDGSVFASGSSIESEVYAVTGRVPLARVTAVRLEMLPDERLPLNGPGQTSLGSFALQEFRFFRILPGGTAEPIELCSARGDYRFPGSSAEAAVDGKRQTAWRNYPRAGETRVAVFFLHEPLEAAGAVVKFELDQNGLEQAGRFRVAVTDRPLPELAELVPAAVEAVIRQPRDERSAEGRRLLAAHYLRKRIERRLHLLPAPRHVYAASNFFDPQGWFAPVALPRPVQVLQRGEIEKPVKDAQPGALSCLGQQRARFALDNPHDEAQRRAALAQWLSDGRNPLTWRSIVNRTWHHHFGRGIVDTPNDFGRMGSEPTHPELLDWLAAEFQSGGGSLKKLHRLLVTSAVYRQASAPRRREAETDADNRYWWRMPRARLDAESLRDAVLQVSGRLDLAAGGPSILQAAVGKNAGGAPTADYDAYDWSGPGAGRRSIYRFTFRTLSDPFMDALNYPNLSLLAPTRVTAVTPLQALALLNNRFMVRHSEYFAGRLKRGASADPVAGAYRLALLRDPSPDEKQDALAYIGRNGLANFCRLLLNSNEFMYVD